MAQNTTAISLVVSFSLFFSRLVNHVVLVWRMNTNRLIWPYLMCFFIFVTCTYFIYLFIFPLVIKFMIVNVCVLVIEVP